MTIVWLGCGQCAHLKPGVKCLAYPGGIPIAIASGEVDHLVERPGQVLGILFKAKEGVSVPVPKVVEWKDEGYLESKG
jgi:hypothetical protein